MRQRERLELISYTDELRHILSDQDKRLCQLGPYKDKRLKSYRNTHGDRYYKCCTPGNRKYVYLGNDSNPEVAKIKEAHFLAKSTKELKREISLIENVLDLSRDISFESINSALSESYRNPAYNKQPETAVALQWKESMEAYKKTFPPFRPEELIHITRDGTYVRSKGEALIYNYLLDLGITFVYELPLRIKFGSKNTLLLPDFTILSEIDYKTVIYIEHQGMMDIPKYRQKFNDAVFKYWLNDYLPERDVFFTFDLPNGGFDDRPIRNIIRHSVRPCS